MGATGLGKAIVRCHSCCGGCCVCPKCQLIHPQPRGPGRLWHGLGWLSRYLKAPSGQRVFSPWCGRGWHFWRVQCIFHPRQKHPVPCQTRMEDPHAGSYNKFRPPRVGWGPVEACGAGDRCSRPTPQPSLQGAHGALMALGQCRKPADHPSESELAHCDLRGSPRHATRSTSWTPAPAFGKNSCPRTLGLHDRRIQLTPGPTTAHRITPALLHAACLGLRQSMTPVCDWFIC